MANISLRSVDAILILSNESSSTRLLAKYYSAPHTTPSPNLAASFGAGTNSNNTPGTPKIDSKSKSSTTNTSSSAPSSGPAFGTLPGQANHPYITLKDQLAFEKGLVEKTAGQTTDIILYDGRIVVFKTVANVTIYVVGPSYENELLLLGVAVCLKDVLSALFVTPNDQQTLDKQTILENYDMVALAVDEIVDDGVILETDRDVILSRISPKPQSDIPNLAELELSEQSLISVWKFARRALKESGF